MPAAVESLPGIAESEQSPELQSLPHYVMDNLPAIAFDATVNCVVNSVSPVTCKQFVDSSAKPNQVLIDLRCASTMVVSQVLSAWLAFKKMQPAAEACILTDNVPVVQNCVDALHIAAQMHSGTQKAAMQNMA